MQFWSRNNIDILKLVFYLYAVSTFQEHGNKYEPVCIYIYIGILHAVHTSKPQHTYHKIPSFNTLVIY
jgi:hypothetical protein